MYKIRSNDDSFWWNLRDCPKCYETKLTQVLSENKLKRSFWPFFPARLNACIYMFIQEYSITCITSDYLKLEFLDLSSLESSSWSPSKKSIESLWRPYHLSEPSSRLSAIRFSKDTEVFCGFGSLSILNIVLQPSNRESDWLDIWELDKVSRIETFCVSHSQLWHKTRSLVSLSLSACWLCPSYIPETQQDRGYY